MKRTRSRRDRKSSPPPPSFASEVDADSSRPGGVSIVGTGGRIDINNTLDERLRLLETDALPMIRASLFGKNENRKFHD